MPYILHVVIIVIFHELNLWLEKYPGLFSMFTDFKLHHTDYSHLLVRNVLAFCSFSETINISVKTREYNASDLSYGSYMYLRAKNLDVDCQTTVIKLMFISLINRPSDRVRGCGTAQFDQSRTIPHNFWKSAKSRTIWKDLVKNLIKSVFPSIAKV